jgi:chromosome segregation ATPase
MVLRELGGYKFFAKPSESIESSTNRKTYNRINENKNTSEVSTLKKIIAEQKENITNREKHVLHLEKKLALVEHENSKYKKQISNFREKLKDCSGTVDYLRREKETLASERDRLSFTLLTCEHELNELRTQNTNLVTEYESAEHSRKIAVGHLQEVERVCHESHQEKPDPTVKRTAEKSGGNVEGNSEKNITQLNSMKEAVEKLRIERELLQNEHKKLGLFVAENLKKVVDHVRDIESTQREVPENSLHTVSEISIHEVIASEEVTSSEEVFLEPDDATRVSEDVSELDAFKEKLKSNEQSIDELANQIRDLENRKKSLLETRFAMIQEFQAGGEVPEDWETDKSGTEAEEKVETESGGKTLFWTNK